MNERAKVIAEAFERIGGVVGAIIHLYVDGVIVAATCTADEHLTTRAQVFQLFPDMEEARAGTFSIFLVQGEDFPGDNWPLPPNFRVGDHRREEANTIDEAVRQIPDFLTTAEDGQHTQGPIRHPKLPPALLKEIQRLWHSVGKAFYGAGSTMEQWESRFMSDTNPDKEALAWQRIERATKRYMADHPKANLSDTVAAICLCSMGAANPDYQVYWNQAAGHVAEDGPHRHGSN